MPIVCSFVMGCSVTVRVCLLWVVEGRSFLYVPSRLSPLGYSEIRDCSVVYGVSLRRDAWVRILQCTVIPVWVGAGTCGSGPPRAEFVARWGSPSVLLSYCHVVYVLSFLYLYPRGGGIFLRLPLSGV